MMHRLSLPFGPLRGAGIELGIAGTALFIAAALRGNAAGTWNHSRQCLIVCGTFWFLNLTLSWLAVSAVNSSGELLVTGLLNYLWPSFTLLFSIPIVGKRANWILGPGLVTAILGIVLGKVATAPTDVTSEAFTHLNITAYSLAVLDALAWALYSNFSRRYSNPNGASAVPLYMLITSMVLLPMSASFDEPYTAGNFDWFLLIVWSLGTAAAYLFWDIGMRFGNVITISSMSMFIPLFSTIITALLSGHDLSPLLIAAAGLVVAGSTLCRWGIE